MATVSSIEEILVASIAEQSSYSGYEDTLGDGHYGYASQSFNTGSNGGGISSCKFHLKAVGTPSFNMVAELYAHSAGVFGTASTKTGSPLATSAVVDANTLTSDFSLVTFEFPKDSMYSMSNNTNYVIVLNCTDSGSGDGNIQIGVRYPSAGEGNYASYSYAGGSYSAAYLDAPFYVYAYKGSLSAKTRIKREVTTTEEMLVRYYIESNRSSSMSMSSENYVVVAQSFKPETTCILSKAKFYITNYANPTPPTGTAVAKLYTHTGAFGSTSKPTGAALATSGTLDVSTLTSSYQTISFEFTGANRYEMQANTPYCIAIEYSGGNYNSRIIVGVDNTTPTSDGNMAYSAFGSPATFNTTSSYDVIFYVYSIGGSLRAKTRIKKLENDKILTVKVKIQLAEVKTRTVTAKIRIKVTRTLPGYVTTVSYYSEDNRNTYRSLYAGSTIKCGQSFLAIDGVADSAQFFVGKHGVPTGTLNVLIYASTGTFGNTTTNKPTGSALATSDSVDLSTLMTDSFALSNFTFSGANRISLTAGTPYFAILNFVSTSSDLSNTVRVGQDTTSPTHDGVGSYLYSLWLNPAIPEDNCFYFYEAYYGNILSKVKILRIINRTVSSKVYILYSRTSVTVEAKVKIKATITKSVSTLLASYTEENQNSYSWLSGAEKIKAAQSFDSGVGGVLSSCKFYIAKYGSPTGNAVATLYAHTYSVGNTWGAYSIPTGTALATSDVFDVATIPSTSLGLITFNFSGANKYPLISNTKYCIAIEYSGGNSSNDFKLGYDNTSSTGAGNGSDMEHGTSVWTAVNGRDYIFYVYAEIGTLSAKVNIFNEVTRTVSAKTRIKFGGIIASDLVAKLFVVHLNSNSISAKVWIKGIWTKAVTSKLDIKKSGIERTMTAKTYIVYLVSKDILAKVWVKGVVTREGLVAVVNIRKMGVVQTIEARVKIVYLISQTASAKTYLVHLQSTSLVAKLAVKNLKTITSLAKVRSKRINNTVGEISAKVRIYKKYKLVKYSHFIGSHTDGSIYTDSDTFYPTTDVDSNPWYYNAGHFNTQKVYLDFDATLLTGVTKAWVRLYDLTDGEEVINSEIPVSSSGHYRTEELTIDSLHEYIAQARIGTGSGYVRICRPKIFILQESSQITKTETYFPVSSASTGFTTTDYQILYPDGVYGSDYNGGVFVYNAAEWNGTMEFYLEAHFGSTEARTNYIQLFDITSNTVVLDSEIESTGDATRQRSQSFTLEDGKYYAIQTKSSSADETATCGEVRLIAYQNTLGEPEKTVTKTITFYDLRLSTAELTVSGTSYAAVSTLDTGSTTDFGFDFDFTLDYESFSFYPKLFVAGRMAANGVGTYSFKAYDLENTRDVTLGLSSSFPYQSKNFGIDAIEGSVLKDAYQRFTLYGHKEVGDSDAVISLYGIYMGVQLKTRNPIASSKVRIVINEDDFNEAIEATIRKITGRLLIKWNGVDWVDETQYLVSAKGNSQYSGRKGEIIADQCDFELDNVNQRFLKDNLDSEISNYIKPSVEIKFAVGINGYYTYLFTGKITSVDPDRKSGIVNISCTDNTSSLLNIVSPTTLYTSKRFNEIIEILADHCGIEPQDYALEESYNIAETVWFEDNTVSDVLTSVVEAERGRLFFDASGKLVFWNKRHFNSQQPVASLNRNLWILNFHSKVDEQEIVNKITITSKPRKPKGVQVVWSNGNAVASDQYNDTLVWIPAASYQNALIELDDPAIEWVMPVASYDFTANSASDGSGTDLTANITVDEFTTYEQQAFLTVTNHGDVDAFLTEFNIRANPLTVYKWIRTIYTDNESISKYGTKDTTIENNWITSDEMANEIKESEINANKESTNTYDLDIIGRPDITAGELISVETKDNYYTVFQVKQNDWTVDSNGYLQSLELAEKEAITTQYEDSYGIGSGIIGGGVIGRSALSRARSKTVSAKVSIKRNISLTATARVRITT